MVKSRHTKWLEGFSITRAGLSFELTDKEVVKGLKHECEKSQIRLPFGQGRVRSSDDIGVGGVYVKENARARPSLGPPEKKLHPR